MSLNISYNFDQFDEGKALKNLLAQTKDTKTATQNSEISAVKNTGNESWSFWDFLDFINPLQHIPIVSSIYRHITGDEIKPPARIIGGAIFGGPIGAVSSIVNAALEESSGKDVGGHVLAMVIPENKPFTTPSAPTQDVLPTSPALVVASLDSENSNHPTIEIHGKNFVDHRGLTVHNAREHDAMREALQQNLLWETQNALEQYQKAYGLRKSL